MTLPAKQPVHSRLGASSMYRWSACPGSVALCDTVPPSVSSSYAKEGTDAHALAAWFLTSGARIETWPLGKEFGYDNHGTWVTFTPNNEMLNAIGVYLNAIADIGVTNPAHRFFEQRFDLSAIHPGCFGTADAVLYDPPQRILHVIDYKHGAGIPVHPKNNPQLLYYGLGALENFKFPVKTIRLTIVQPRCGDPENAVRSWDVDLMTLIDFRADLKGYAEAAEAPNALLHAGDHCRFCPAAAICPELNAKRLRAVQMDFSPQVDYNPQALRAALDARPAVQAWLKAVDQFAYAEAEAGRCPPGYKLVNKKARRAWRDEEAALKFLKQSKFPESEILEPVSLKSPAQIEKLTGKNFMNAFVVAESSGTTLVADSDPRLPVTRSAEADFKAIEN